MQDIDTQIPKKVLREINADDKTGINTVSRLHMELLGFGPMAGLGERFIREICYVKPVADGLMRLALYEVDGEPAGFVAYTAQSISFHRRALKDHWIYAGWLTLYALIEKPKRLKALIRAIKVILSRRSENKTGVDPMGEVICIAVSPKFLKGKFVRQSGILVSDDLVRYSAKYLQKAGVAEMRMLVDADNKAPLFLYHKMGASFEDYQQAGEPLVQVWFDLVNKPLVETPVGSEAWTINKKTVESGSEKNDWQDYWEEIGDDKKFFRIEAAEYVNRLSKYIDVQSGTRLLDFGCGFGHVAERLAKKAGSVLIWDKAKSIRMRARTRLAYLDNIELVNMEGDSNVLPSGLDYILVHSVIQYMNQSELNTWLLKWQNCLADGGSLVISDIITPESSSMHELFKYLLFSLKNGFFMDALINGAKEFARYFGARNTMSLLRFNQDSFKSCAEAAGFSIKILDKNLSYRDKRFTAVLKK